MANQGDGFEIPISFPINRSGAVDADKLLADIRAQVKGVSDETKDYNEWLAKNAKELGEVSKAHATAAAELVRYQAELEKAQAAAAAESDRYQNTLEKMAQAQILESAEKQKAIKWTQSLKEGTVDLSMTQSVLEKNVAATASATETLTVKKKEWLKIAKLLPPELHAIGSALKLVFSSPLVAAVAGLLFAISKVVDVVKEAKLKLDALKLSDLSKDLSGAAEAASRNATNWESWDAAMKNSAQSSGDVLANMRAISEAAEKVADAQFDLARAKVEGDASLSPEQKAWRLEEINGQQRQDKSSRSGALRKAGIAATEKQLAEAIAADEGALAGRKGFADKAASAAYAETETKNLLATLEADIARLLERRKTIGLLPDENTTLQVAGTQRANLLARIPDLESASKSTAGALAEYDKAAGARRNSIPGLRSQLAGQQQTDSLLSSTDKQVLGLQWDAAQTRQQSGWRASATSSGQGAAAGLVLGAAAGADALKAGQTIPQDQAAAITKVTQLLGLTGQSNATILDMLSRMNDNQKSFSSALQQTNQRISDAKSGLRVSAQLHQ